MPTMMSTTGQLSHLAAVIAFAILAAMLLLRRSPTGVRLAVALASILTACWALGQMIVGRYGIDAFPWLSRFETLRTAAWIAVLLLLQRRSLGLASSPQQSFVIALGLGFVVALQLALDILFQFGAANLPLAQQPSAALLLVASRLVLSISGLVLLHNLYVNSGNDGGLSFRLFAVGLGVIFAYDLNLYTLYFLVGQPNHALIEIRGAVNMLAAPLIYLSLRHEGDGRFQLSRQAAFQTVSFSMIGLYLIAMSVLAYGLKITGGNWGQLLQITFLTATLIIGTLAALSPRIRAEIRVRISRNFYRYRYDYRVEWLRFIDKIDAASGAAGDTPFRERLIEAVATVVESPGGAILEPSDAGVYQQTARWGWPSLVAPQVSGSSAILMFFAETGRIVEFDQLRAEAAGGGGSSHGSLKLPDWAGADRSIWLAIPLIHRQHLSAVLLLQRSLAAPDLNWEDFDFLRTLARQGASYLAEAKNQARLDEARSFDEYNRRFAFVMHDVKNVVSQLGLVARNAERHADKPEFRADMIATLNASVSKMTDLLKLMGRQSEEKPAADASEADVAQLLGMVATTLRRQHPALEVEGIAAPVCVHGNASRLEAMLTHLVQNAIDASAPDAPIRLALHMVGDATGEGAEVCITITDSGHGMSPGFIRDELFKPFRSTKDGGFGIGAFEAREIIRVHGGRLEVHSAPGEGSCFTITLPRPQPGGTAGKKVHRA